MAAALRGMEQRIASLKEDLARLHPETTFNSQLRQQPAALRPGERENSTAHSAEAAIRCSFVVHPPQDLRWTLLPADFPALPESKQALPPAEVDPEKEQQFEAMVAAIADPEARQSLCRMWRRMERAKR